MAEKLGAEDRRKARVRRAIRKAANGRPRLSVFRSSKQIYAQVIDDERGTTLAAASSLEKDMRDKLIDYLATHYPPNTHRQPTLVSGSAQISLKEWTMPRLGQRSRVPEHRQAPAC